MIDWRVAELSKKVARTGSPFTQDTKHIFLLSYMYLTVYLLFALQAGTYTINIKFGQIK